MKKTKKQESLENILNYEELSILKGGQMAVRNVNSTPACECIYNNSSLLNKNTSGDCSCTCV